MVLKWLYQREGHLKQEETKDARMFGNLKYLIFLNVANVGSLEYHIEFVVIVGFIKISASRGYPLCNA